MQLIPPHVGKHVCKHIPEEASGWKRYKESVNSEYRWKRDCDLNLIKVHVEQVLVGNEEKSKVERQEERKGHWAEKSDFPAGCIIVAAANHYV